MTTERHQDRRDDSALHERIKTLILAGHTYKEVSTILNVNPAVIHAHVADDQEISLARARGELRPSRKPKNPAELAKHPAVVEVLAGGTTVSASSRHGISHQTLSNWVRRVKSHLQGSGPNSNISHTAAGTPVPVLSTVPAGKLTEAMRDEALGMVLSTSRKVAKGCYALSVVGDSMTAPPGSTDSFPEGCTIVIKPCDDAVHGQFVVAQNDETGEWTFKKYQSLGLDSPLLIPLNPVGHLPIDMGKARLRVVGALIESLVIKLY